MYNISKKLYICVYLQYTIMLNNAYNEKIITLLAKGTVKALSGQV